MAHIAAPVTTRSDFSQQRKRGRAQTERQISLHYGTRLPVIHSADFILYYVFTVYNR